ncbi:putative cyclase-domain-containing protein [Xylariales sp. PMI_506]|nr:putative cyclase-domain-containing protein [Xylariales sp. PMI_506]
MSHPPSEIPAFSDLPLDASHPPHAAWGVWGKSDRLGTLNHLTPDRVVEAARQIRTGLRIRLDLPLKQNFLRPGFRPSPVHEIYSIGDNMHDDKIHFNTQTSSQWDGFGHCGYSSGHFYNGATAEQVRSGDSPIGIEAWSRQGIVGRGVLIDFAAYAKRHNIAGYDAAGRSEIKLDDVKAIAKECRVEFQPGDILILRTGFVQACQNKTYEEQEAISQESPGQYPGISGSIETLEWLWDNHFAAVCGDCPSFEAWPPRDLKMHEVLLAGFGMPIGELFDLEELASHCETSQRWTFFLASSPLNIEGGVASPPNAIAIF